LDRARASASKSSSRMGGGDVQKNLGCRKYRGTKCSLGECWAQMLEGNKIFRGHHCPCEYEDKKNEMVRAICESEGKPGKLAEWSSVPRGTQGDKQGRRSFRVALLGKPRSVGVNAAE